MKLTRIMGMLLLCAFSLFAAEINVPVDHSTIQAAINAAVDGDTIIVMPGTYLENINISGSGSTDNPKSITVRSFDPTDSDVIMSTVIDGQANGSVVSCQSGEDPNTILDGFLIKNGTGTLVGTRTYGGGIFIINSSPTIRRCVISDNNSDYGSGMSIRESSALVTFCTFSGNNAESFGGGLYNSSTPTVSHCLFVNNKASAGGGITTYNSFNGELCDCTFIGNISNGVGGGIDIVQDSLTVNNCVFSGNYAAHAGGGIANRDLTRLEAVNCTFNGNTAASFAGAIYSGEEVLSLPSLTGCKFCINTPNALNSSYIDYGGNVFNYCQNVLPLFEPVTADLTGDGKVDIADFAILAANWLSGS